MYFDSDYVESNTNTHVNQSKKWGYIFLEFLCLHLTSLDDTSVDQFHDLLANSRILHVILQGGGVGLSLLEDGLHNGVAHNAL